MQRFCHALQARLPLMPGGLDRRVGQCVLWMAGVDWNAVQGTDRQIVTAFDRPVVWVDSPVSPLRPTGRWLPAELGGVSVLREDPLLVRIAPVSVPFGSRPIMRALPSPLKRLQVRRVLDRIGATPETVVYTYLDGTPKRWGGDAVEVLLGTDDYVAGAELMGLSRRWLANLEQEALARADVVLAVSPQLAERWRGLGAEPHVLRNGCTRVPAAAITDPARLRGRGPGDPPVVGVVGQLSSRIDLRILEALAAAGIRLLLVGPKDPSWEPDRWESLVQRDTVTCVGRVPAEEVPALLATVDVGLTPYADSAFNRASFPLKTLEYLGGGLPVASSDMPASRWIEQEMSARLGGDVSNHLRICSSAGDFIEGVRQLAAQRSPALDAERWQFAQLHSWHHRVQELEALVDEFRARRSSLPAGPLHRSRPQ
jgi:teichuronic acid biosynthesis glycosyltransferase TuaH